MTSPDSPALFPSILTFADIAGVRDAYRQAGKVVVSTNGCFDLLHPGHVDFLLRARSLGDVLIVGLNSDDSVRRLKGAGRPLLPADQRAHMLAALKPVDHVIVFDDLLPSHLLEQLQPDIHCKAADYTPASLPEAEVVQRYSGEIRILPLSPGFSTSQMLAHLAETKDASEPADGTAGAERRSFVFDELLQSGNVLRQAAYRLSDEVCAVAERLTEVLLAGGKILLCGNGGSAADAQHIATELVVRYRRDRQAMAAIALTTDTSTLTAAGNDYGFEYIFARQVAALGQPGDALIAISTSGRSANVLRAAETAAERGLFTVGCTGQEPSPLAEICDSCLAAPSNITARVQQTHITMLHVVCDLVEQAVAEANG